MILIPDLVIVALALYIGYLTLRAWRSLADWRLSLYSFGMLMLAVSLAVEAVADFLLRLAVGYTPWRFVIHQAASLRVILLLLQLIALVPLAVAVTPTSLYAAVPLLLFLLPVNVALSLYIAVVTLLRSLERGVAPWISIAFIFFAASIMTPLFAFQDVVFRSLTALFLALGLAYGQEKKEK